MRSVITAFLVALGSLTAHADAAADAVWAKMAAKLDAAKSMTMTMESDLGGGAVSMRCAYLRPNYMKMESDAFCIYFDGKNQWMYSPLSHEYFRLGDTSQVPFGMNARDGLGLGITEAKPNLGHLGEKDFDGRRCFVLRCTWPEASESRATMYVDEATYLPAGYEATGGSFTMTLVLRNIKLDAGLRAKDFAWKPPKGAKLVETPAEPKSGDWMGSYHGVSAFSNGPDAYSAKGKYICSEFVNRFYHDAIGMDTSHWGANGSYYDNAWIMGLDRYANGGEEPPRPDDIMCWQYTSGESHVAIVMMTWSDSVKIIEQNGYSCYRTIPMAIVKGHYAVGGSDEGKMIQGWLHMPGHPKP